MNIDKYIVDVAQEDVLLQRPNVNSQKLHPRLLVADLVHVNVSRWNILISSNQTIVLDNNQVVTNAMLMKY